MTEVSAKNSFGPPLGRMVRRTAIGLSIVTFIAIGAGFLIFRGLADEPATNGFVLLPLPRSTMPLGDVLNANMQIEITGCILGTVRTARSASLTRDYSNSDKAVLEGSLKQIFKVSLNTESLSKITLVANDVETNELVNWTGKRDPECANQLRQRYPGNSIQNAAYVVRANKAKNFRLEAKNKDGGSVNLKSQIAETGSASGNLQFANDGTMTVSGEDLFWEVSIERGFPQDREFMRCILNELCSPNTNDMLIMNYSIGFFSSTFTVCRRGYCNPGMPGYREYAVRGGRVSTAYDDGAKMLLMEVEHIPFSVPYAVRVDIREVPRAGPEAASSPTPKK